MKKQFQEAASLSLTPLRPHLKWIVVAFAVLISIGSILYTNNLVEQIREREKRQIDIYASSLEFLGAESETNFFLIFQEIVKANHTIPVILTDEAGNPSDYKNLPKADGIEDSEERRTFLLEKIVWMQNQHEPITVPLTDDQDKVLGYNYIYYENSFLLSQLKFYPYIQLSAIGIFGIITFLILNYLKKTEQNQVWVGLAKETAHQLGTPLSSLMAWSAYFKELYPDQRDTLLEFDKDVDRLKTITDRFSSIGSEPQLEERNIAETIDEIVGYLQRRLPSKVKISISAFPSKNISGWINSSLFAWVIENLLKNAADAMDGSGDIGIQILRANEGQIAIDISDTGKGIPKSKVKDVFRPGYTTKKRGWGLGLTLVKRIVEQYHEGKIFVKDSEINVGTTFRIYLKS